FAAGRAMVIATGANGSPSSTGVPGEIVITVDGGYAPSIIRVPAGSPTRLVFDRKDNSSCSEEVVFPDFSIRKYLPTGKRTTIEVTPPTAGRYEFMCGMSMLRGTLIAEDGKVA
ncbi:MAG: cupredoxin domain-containing protein, partial [Longimicrobiales bacterium]